MNSQSLLIFFLSTFACFIGCNEVAFEKKNDATTETFTFDQEKAAILETLNKETEAAFQRNYDDWQDKWVHDPNITKTYIDFTDSSFTESVGWAEISAFVKTFIEEHPEPEPLPKLVDDINVRLYGNGAWVTFHQHDSLRGQKRETRLMEKVNGHWKIAGMHTTIYGFDQENKD